MASSSLSSSAESYAVIGGEGFLGQAMVKGLCARYPSSSVLSLDIEQRHASEKQSWSFQTCDLTSLESLTSAFRGRGVTTVIHTASPWTGSGKDVCEKVNVHGTSTVVQACKETGVRKLVYTSSAGVVFDGTDLINIDERAGPPEVPMDAYNDTKARAEAIVLAANGQDGLFTCAIRPAGIFGPGDRQNIPGWIGVYKAGKTKISLGDNENIFDLTYVDNVVHAHLLAAEKLEQRVPVSAFEGRLPPTEGSLPRRPLPTSATAPMGGSGDSISTERRERLNPRLPAKRNRFDQWFDLQHVDPDSEDGTIPIAGQAYYVSNGEPIAFWAWGRAIWYEYAGHDKKMFALPASVGFLYAQVLDIFSRITGRENIMSLDKIKYSVAKRYYNIEKARCMLGYEPIVGLDEGLKKAVAWYKANEASLNTAAPAKKA